MKLLLLLTTLSMSGFAQDLSNYWYTSENAVPVIEKGSSSGYTPEEWRRSEVCRVYLDKVVIHKGVGKVDYKELIDFKINKSVIKVAQAAMKEKNKDNNDLPRPCDIPGTWIRVLGQSGEAVLYSSGGCGSTKIEKEGPNTRIIKDIINRYCPKTH